MLVIEIIPKDQNNNPYVQIPRNADRTHGVWITDNPHGWNELHTAWKIKILQYNVLIFLPSKSFDQQYQRAILID